MRGVFVLMASAAMLLVAGVVGAQTLDIVPLDEAAAEVQAFKARRGADAGAAAAPFAGATAALAGSNTPPGLFVVGVVPGQSAGAAVATDISLGDAAAAATAATQGLGDIVFDPQNKTWMSIPYPSPLEVDLYCSWRIDRTAQAAAEKYAAEQALEGAAASVEAKPPAAAAAQLPREAAAVDPEQDPESDQTEVEKAFTIAGRPCTVRHVCKGSDDPRCSIAYLDSVIAQIGILQLGDGP